MRPNVRYLEVFRAVIKSGSVTTAARTLNISQPAVTKTLRQLELELGLTLFSRIRGRLVPTPEAEVILPSVERMFGSLASVGQLADQIKSGINGRVAIASVTNLAMSLVANAITEVLREYPDIGFDVYALPTKHVIEYVSTRQVDVGVLDVQSTVPGVDVEEISVNAISCIMRCDSSLSAFKEITPDLLKDMLLISFPDETQTALRLRETFRRSDVPYRIGLTMNSAATACSVINKDPRIVGLLDPFILTSGAFPDLVQRPFLPKVEMRPHLLYPTGRPLSIAAGKLVESMKSASGNSSMKG